MSTQAAPVAQTVKTIKTSDLIADFLAAHNIRHVFGIIGAGNSHTFDSILRKGYTQIICVHHEQAACMAAMSYYRTHGQMSAVLVTTGAGSTNAVTGVVSAWMDSIPCLIISGNENSKFTHADNPLRIWGVQGYDSVEMVRKVTKYAQRVLEPAQTWEVLSTAFEQATTGKPGPCWVDFPLNIQAASIPEPTAKPLLKSAAEFNNAPATLSAQRGAAEVLSALKTAKRPVIWLGHGIRMAQALELVEPMVNALQCPVLVTWAGIDMIASDHPLVFGRAGVYGQRAANFVLQNCDFLLTIGTRLAIPQVGYDLSEFARAALIASVDIDATEVLKHGSKINFPIHADAKDFITQLLSQLKHSELDTTEYSQWRTQCRYYQQKYPVVAKEHADQNGFINSYPFMQRLAKHFKPQQIVVTDMGTALLSGHQVLAMQQGQRLMTSTGLGEMGYGLPAAVGASFATSKGEVLCLNCDGGMMLNLQELQTIVHHHLPIKIIIFNNDGYLMIKHTQKALFSGRYAGTDKQSGVSCPDYGAVAKAFGIPAYTIRNWEEFEKVIPELQAHTGAVICEVFTHPEQLFVPKLSLALQADGSIVSPPLED